MRRFAAATLFTAMIATGFVDLVQFGQTYSCASCDFDTYVAAAHRLVAGESLYGAFQAEPYLLIEAARGGGYVYPPTAAVLMAWVGITPELVWRLVNLCSLLVVAVLLVRRGGLLAQLGAAAIVVLAPPTAFAWANGNVTPLLAAGFGLAFLYPRTAWVIASVGGAVKLFPLVLFAWVLRERGWRDVVRGLAVLTAIVLLSIPLTDETAWAAFIQASTNALPNCRYAPLNSLACTFGPSGQIAAFAIAGLLCLGSLVVTSRVLAFAMLCAAVLVATADLNRPYWLLALMAMLAAAGSLTNDRTRRLLPRCTQIPLTSIFRSDK